MTIFKSMDKQWSCVATGRASDT